MMIDKRLIGTVRESQKYIAGNVVFQWCSLLGNIAMMTAITHLLADMLLGKAERGTFMATTTVAVAAVLVRFFLCSGFCEDGISVFKGSKEDPAREDLR